jgi:hypothetical protein
LFFRHFRRPEVLCNSGAVIASPFVIPAKAGIQQRIASSTVIFAKAGNAVVAILF